MATSIKVTVTTTLLIGLQLFSLGRACAESQPDLFNDAPAKKVFVAKQSVTWLGQTAKNTDKKKKFEPPNNEGPKKTVGAGRR